MPQPSYRDFLERWEARRNDFRRLHIQLDGALLLDELLAEVRQWREAECAEAVTLQEAHRLGGYSVDHLQRLVASGRIQNVGRKGSPKMRRADVPVRPGYALPPAPGESQFLARRRMASAVTSRAGGE